MAQHTELNGASNNILCLKSALRRIGISQIISASFCIIFGISCTAIAIEHNKNTFTFSNFYAQGRFSAVALPITAVGLWSSVWTLIAGGLAVCGGGRGTNSGLIVAHMVIAIIGTLSEFSGSITAGVTASAMQNLYVVKGKVRSFHTLYILISILEALSFILLIISSAISCKLSSCCCANSSAPQQAVYIPQQTMVQTDQGVVVVPQSQAPVMVQQPIGYVPANQVGTQYNHPYQVNQSTSGPLIQQEETKVSPPPAYS